MHGSGWQNAGPDNPPTPLGGDADSHPAGAGTSHGDPRPDASRRRAARLLAILATAGMGAFALAPAWGQYPDGPFPRSMIILHGYIQGTAEELAAFDVMQAPWWNAEGPESALMVGAKALNPDLVNLVYVNPISGSAPDEPDPDHIVNSFFGLVDDAWLVLNDRGDPVEFPQWPHMRIMDLTSQCPRVAGRTWGEVIADFTVDEVLATGLYEGVQFDNLWRDLAWVNQHIEGSLDLDRDGVADHPDSVDVWWQLGMEAMLARFRARAGDGVLASGNGNGDHFTTLNGRHFEAFPREGWAEGLAHADLWRQLGRQPSLLSFATRGAIDDYEQVRFGLCSALMVGGLFFHEPSSAPFFNVTVYDEFGADLGLPTGERYEVGFETVAAADFESVPLEGWQLNCGYGIAEVTADPELVLGGVRSLLGRTQDPPPVTFNGFACTDPDVMPLADGGAYTVEFDYLVVEAPPPNGSFYVGVRADDGPQAGIANFGGPSGFTGHVRESFTAIGPASSLFFGVAGGGEVVIDDFLITQGEGGILRRDFEHGVALVNPGNQPVTVDLGETFRRLDGEQDPLTNDGQEVRELTLPAQDGLVLLRVGSGTVGGPPEDPPDDPGDPGTSTPPAPRVPVVFPNPARMSQVPAVTISGVPPGGVVEIFSVDGRLLRRLEPQGDSGQVGWDLRTHLADPVAPGLYVAVVQDAARRPLETLRVALRR